jgi:hypothetical protein
MTMATSATCQVEQPSRDSYALKQLWVRVLLDGVLLRLGCYAEMCTAAADHRRAMAGQGVTAAAAQPATQALWLD